MLQKSLIRGLALACLLLMVAHVQAGNGLPPIPEGVPEGEPQANEVRDAAMTAAQQTLQRAENTVQEAQDQAQQLRSGAEQLLQPVQQTVDDLRRDVEDLIAPRPDERPDEAPEMVAQSQASMPVDQTMYKPVILLGATAAGLGFLLWFLGQSATIGAGAAGTAAAADGRRFLPYASPLFTRFEKDTVLGHPKREALYGAIVGKPGVTLQDLCADSGLSRTAVTHHLRLLEQQHLIVSKRVGRSRHFFENGGRYGRDQKEAYAVLHNERTKEIADFIKDHPGAIQKDLCAKFDIQASVAHWHVKRLLEANLVESIRDGRTVSYFPSADIAAPAYA